MRENLNKKNGKARFKKKCYFPSFLHFFLTPENCFSMQGLLLWAFIMTKSLNFIWMDADARAPQVLWPLSTKPFHMLKRRHQTAFHSGPAWPLATTTSIWRSRALSSGHPGSWWGWGWLESDSGRHQGLLVAFWTNYWSHGMYILRQRIKLNVMN